MRNHKCDTYLGLKTRVQIHEYTNDTDDYI